MNDVLDVVIERLRSGGVTITQKEEQVYLAAPDSLGKADKTAVVAVGYKRCGRCEEIKKFHLFNKNSASKQNCSGSCKECQKANAKKSYAKTKKQRNYQKYYQENKEAKREQARKYYEKNKEQLNAKHKVYVQSKAGKATMQKAHAKRRAALSLASGVPFTRSLVIERDGAFIGKEHPECYLCHKPITDVTGTGLHIDHVVPIVQGGLNCFTNVASTHSECNLRREKDARELTTAQVNVVKLRAETFIEANPDRFE